MSLPIYVAEVKVLDVFLARRRIFSGKFFLMQDCAAREGATD